MNGRIPILDSHGRVTAWYDPILDALIPNRNYNPNGTNTRTTSPTTSRAGRKQTGKKRTHPKVKKVVSTAGRKVVAVSTRNEVTHVTTPLLTGSRNKPTHRGNRVKVLPTANVVHATPQAVAFNHREPITAKVAKMDSTAPKIPVRVPEIPPTPKRKAATPPPPPERRAVVRSGRVKPV